MIPTTRANAESLARAVGLLRAGGVVGFPTETLYGLAVEALNRAAVAKLVHVKGRAEAQPFPVLISNRDMLEQLVLAVPARAVALMDAHWPGPLTLVLPARPGLPAPLIGPGGGIGVRISSDPVAAALVEQVGSPLTATSANRSGRAPATTADAAALLEGVDLVLDDGPRRNPPSTVVDLLGEEPIVLRSGAVQLGD